MMMIAILLAAAAPPASGQTQYDLNMRGANAYHAADAALNAQYRRLMALMVASDRTRDDDLRKGIEKPDGDPGYRAALLAAQRAWLAYRDASCIVGGFEYRGGSAQGMAKAQCLTALTRARTAELKQQYESLSQP